MFADLLSFFAIDGVAKRLKRNSMFQVQPWDSHRGPSSLPARRRTLEWSRVPDQKTSRCVR